MSQKITKNDFQRIAKLSRLPVTDKDVYIADQLSQAAEYVEILNELNTNDVPPTFQVNHKADVFRGDKVMPSFTQKQALSQAKSTYNGYFKTSATIKK